jgi:dolichol-phosphate mannosyltransferase
MKRGIVIPTYNEYNNIARVVPEIFQVDPDLNILVVDDNSPDGTAEVVRKLSTRYPQKVSLISQDQKYGLGPAYIRGITQAMDWGWDLICEMDADLSHQPIYLKALFHHARHFDLVMGSRYIKGGGIENWPWFRRFLSRYGNLYARRVLGVGIQDLTSGFRCYRRRVLESINLQDIRSNGYSFQIETAYRTALHGFVIKEIPIIFVERELGRSKMSRSIIWEAVLMVWKLRFNRRKLMPPTEEALPDEVMPAMLSARKARKLRRKARKVKAKHLASTRRE